MALNKSGELRGVKDVESFMRCEALTKLAIADNFTKEFLEVLQSEAVLYYSIWSESIPEQLPNSSHDEGHV